MKSVVVAGSSQNSGSALGRSGSCSDEAWRCGSRLLLMRVKRASPVEEVGVAEAMEIGLTQSSRMPVGARTCAAWNEVLVMDGEIRWVGTAVRRGQEKHYCHQLVW